MWTASGHSNLNDEQLVATVRSEEYSLTIQEALEELFRRHSSALLAFLTSRVKPQSEAEEIASEVWVKVIEVAGVQFRGGNFRAWLFQIARNKMIDFFRKKHPDALSDHHEIEESVDSAALLIQTERVRALKSCIEQLGDSRKLIVIARMQGISSQEISASHDILVKTIDTRYSRAKTDLAKCMKQKQVT